MLAADPDSWSTNRHRCHPPGRARYSFIAVHAAAITFAELGWDLESITRDGKDRTPVIPSHEMSGIVAGLGAGVAGPAASEEVVGLIGFDRDGAAAEYVVVPAPARTPSRSRSPTWRRRRCRSRR